MRVLTKFALVVVSVFVFPALSFAGVAGNYSVSGMLTSPSIQQCYFSLSVQVEEAAVSLSQFSCGQLNFMGGSVKISGQGALPGERLLRNDGGAIVGTISDSLLQYQESGVTIRISMRGENKAFLQFNVSPYILTGNMTRR